MSKSGGYLETICAQVQGEEKFKGRMDTGENQNRRIIQPQNQSNSAGCLITLPTHIQETKKLIKRNGETVEIVTLTLTSNSPKIVQAAAEKQQTTVEQPVHQQESDHTDLQNGLVVCDQVDVGSFVVTDDINKDTGTVGTSAAVVVGGNEDNDDDNDGTTTKVLLLDSTAAHSASADIDNHQKLVAGQSDDPHGNFLIVSGSNSGFTANSSQDEKLTFITTTATTDDCGNSIVNISSSDNVTTADDSAAGTSGMASQNMSLVQMVDASDLSSVQNNSTVVAASNSATGGMSGINIDGK